MLINASLRSRAPPNPLSKEGRQGPRSMRSCRRRRQNGGGSLYLGSFGRIIGHLSLTNLAKVEFIIGPGKFSAQITISIGPIARCASRRCTSLILSCPVKVHTNLSIHLLKGVGWGSRVWDLGPGLCFPGGSWTQPDTLCSKP